MSLQTYDTHTLIGVIQTLFPPSSYWLDNFFPTVQTFEQEFIDFDLVKGTRRMAPFVAPTVSGKPIMALGYQTKRFKPAYIKPKDIIDPNRIIKRRAGEAFMGSLSLGQRRDAVVADTLQEFKNQIYRRWEWMACQAIVNGSVTVVGDDYPSTFVDFGRSAGQTVTLSGTNLWTDQTNSNPIQDIENWALQTQTLSGVPLTRITMGTTAFRAYRTHPKVIAQLNTLQRGTIDVVLTTALKGEIAQFVGYVGSGSIEIWVYNDIYEDNTGAAVAFLDPTKVVLTSAQIGGVRCFGAILDAKAGYTPIDIFVKSWENEDPSVEYLLAQSAPLMVPTRPDASLVAKVV
jgi:hypothetical protein